MRGVRTHVSDPKSNTDCNMDLKNIPDILKYAPSWSRILVIRAQLFQVFLKMPTTTSQLSSPAFMKRPRYLKKVTVYSGSPYAFNSLSLLSHNYSSARRWRFLSTPLAHCAESRYIPISACQGTNMLRQGHHGWERFLSSNMMTVYSTCWWNK